MKKYVLLFSIGIFQFLSFAQNNQAIYVDTTYWQGGTVQLNGQVGVSGTALQKDIFGKLLFGGYIDQEMKDASFEKHNPVNRFGVTAQNDITYFHASKKLFGSEQLNWGVRAGYNAVGALTYSDDLFGAIFYGNQKYLGDTIFFSNNRGRLTQFQTLGIGVQMKKNGSYLFLNAVNVQNYFDLSFRKSYLAQNTDASDLDLSLRGSAAYALGNELNKGFGFSFDGAYNMRVQWLKEKSALFEVSVHNVGLAKINQMVQYEADSTYSYSGFTFNQLTSDASPFKRDDFNVLDSLGIQRDTISKWIALPGYFQLSKNVDLLSDLKVQSYFGVRIYPSLNINPSAYLGVFYRPVKAFSVAGMVAVGGMAKVRYGLTVGYHSKQFQFTLGSDDIDGWVTKTAYGQSLVLRSIWKI